MLRPKLLLPKPHNCGIGVTLENTDDGEGVLVVAVEIGGAAAAAGLVAGQVITNVNAHAIGTHAEAVALIDNVSDGGQIALTLKEGQAGAAYPSRPCTPPSSRAKHRALFRPLVASPLK